MSQKEVQKEFARHFIKSFNGSTLEVKNKQTHSYLIGKSGFSLGL